MVIAGNGNNIALYRKGIILKLVNARILTQNSCCCKYVLVTSQLFKSICLEGKKYFVKEHGNMKEPPQCHIYNNVMKYNSYIENKTLEKEVHFYLKICKKELDFLMSPID